MTVEDNIPRKTLLISIYELTFAKFEILSQKKLIKDLNVPYFFKQYSWQLVRQLNCHIWPITIQN